MGYIVGNLSKNNSIKVILDKNKKVFAMFPYGSEDLPSDYDFDSPWKNLYSPNNVLELTDPATFQDTTKVRGACFRPAVDSHEYARGYFSGYVFRGDSRPITIVLKNGFEVQTPLTSMDQLPKVAGAIGGITDSLGVSTTVCAQVASTYRSDQLTSIITGLAYLIDAVNFAGFAIPSPRNKHPFVSEFPILAALYEANFAHSIPNTSIVGAVWPGDRAQPVAGKPWPCYPKTLRLAVNPEYEGGMEGAKDVVALFNNVRVGGRRRNSRENA